MENQILRKSSNIVYSLYGLLNQISYEKINIVRSKNWIESPRIIASIKSNEQKI